MKGVAMTLIPGRPAVIQSLHAQPSLEDLQRVVEGYIELVPGLTSVEIAGKIHRCVAFCNEEGKLHRQDRGPMNPNRGGDALLGGSDRPPRRRSLAWRFLGGPGADPLGRRGIHGPMSLKSPRLRFVDL